MPSLSAAHRKTPWAIKAPISHGIQPARGWTWMAKPQPVLLPSNKTELAGTIHYLRGPTSRLSNTLSELIRCLFKAEANVNTKLKVNWLTRRVLCLVISVKNELLALRPCAGGAISCSHQGCGGKPSPHLIRLKFKCLLCLGRGTRHRECFLTGQCFEFRG